jgi:acetoin utilization protein AcuB
MKISYKGFFREKIKKEVVTIRPETSFYEAKMLIHDKGIRHLPVTDNKNRLVGIVTDRDIREAGPSGATDLDIHEIHYLLSKLKVSSFMTPKEKLITITPESVFEEAVELMHDHKIGCLPILEEGKLYGIITETDILANFVEIFGLKRKGIRLTIALENEPDATEKVFQILKKHQARPISILSPSFLVDGKRLLLLRLQPDDFERILDELKKENIEVLSIGQWPSK